MKYYKIQADTINKVVGDMASIKMIDSYNYGASDSVYKLKRRGKLDFTPNLYGILLQKRAKLMDMIISVPFAGRGLIISENLLSVLLKSAIPAETQIFDATVIFKEQEWPYKFIYIFDAKENEIVNWKESQFYETTVGGEKIGGITVLTFNEFESHAKQLDKFFRPKKLVLQKNKLSAEFFRLDYTHLGYCVSENLKSEIEKAGCQGIRFTPLDELVELEIR